MLCSIIFWMKFSLLPTTGFVIQSALAPNQYMAGTGVTLVQARNFPKLLLVQFIHRNVHCSCEENCGSYLFIMWRIFSNNCHSSQFYILVASLVSLEQVTLWPVGVTSVQFLLTFLPWITWGQENKGNDHQLKKLLIV